MTLVLLLLQLVIAEPALAQARCGQTRIVRLSPENEAVAQAYFDNVVDRVRRPRGQKHLALAHVIVESDRPCRAVVVNTNFGYIYWNAHYLLRHPYVDTDYFVAARELTRFGRFNRGLRSRAAQEYDADLTALRDHVLRRDPDRPALVHPGTLFDYLEDLDDSGDRPSGRGLATLAKLLVATDESGRAYPKAPTPRPGMAAVLTELRDLVGPRVIGSRVRPRLPGPELNAATRVHARLVEDELGVLRALDERRRHVEGRLSKPEAFELGVEYLHAMRSLLARIEREQNTPALARTLERFATLTEPDGRPARHFFEFWGHFLDDHAAELAPVAGVAAEALARDFAWRFDLPADLVGPDARAAEDVARNLLLTSVLDVGAPVVTLALGRIAVLALREPVDFSARPLSAAILAYYDTAAHGLTRDASKLMRQFRRAFRRSGVSRERTSASLRDLEAAHAREVGLAVNLARLRFTLDVGTMLPTDEAAGSGEAAGSAPEPTPLAGAEASTARGDAARRSAFTRRSFSRLVEDLRIWTEVLGSRDLPLDVVIGLVDFLRGEGPLPSVLRKELELRLAKANSPLPPADFARQLQNGFFELSTFERTSLTQLVIDGASGAVESNRAFRRALFRKILAGLPDPDARRDFLARWTEHVTAVPVSMRTTLLATALAETSATQRLPRPAFVSRAEAWDLARQAWGDVRDQGLRLKTVVSSSDERVVLRFRHLRTGTEVMHHLPRTARSLVARFARALRAEPRPTILRYGVLSAVYSTIQDWWITRVSGAAHMDRAFNATCEEALIRIED